MTIGSGVGFAFSCFGLSVLVNPRVGKGDIIGESTEQGV